jgi:phage shock protein C
MGAARARRQAAAMNTDTSTAAGPQTPYEPPPDDETGREPRELERPREGRMVAGVCAGIARYFDVDVTIVRIVLAALTVAGGAGVALYAAGWLLMPEAGSPQSIAAEFLGSAGH